MESIGSAITEITSETCVYYSAGILKDLAVLEFERAWPLRAARVRTTHLVFTEQLMRILSLWDLLQKLNGLQMTLRLQELNLSSHITDQTMPSESSHASPPNLSKSDSELTGTNSDLLQGQHCSEMAAP